MTDKYKISDLAKDFNMKSKDLIAIITEITGSEKKSGGVLSPEETSLVFAKLTADNTVKSFDNYFATGAESREKAKKAREEEKNKKLLEQMAILEQLKAAAAAEAGEAKPEKKTEPKAEKKAAKKPVEKTEAKPEKKEEKKAEAKPEKKAEPKKAEPKPETSKKAEPVAVLPLQPVIIASVSAAVTIIEIIFFIFMSPFRTCMHLFDCYNSYFRSTM